MFTPVNYRECSWSHVFNRKLQRPQFQKIMGGRKGSVQSNSLPGVSIDFILDSECTPACASVCTHARLSSFRREPQHKTSIPTDFWHNVTRLGRVGHSEGRDSAETGSLNAPKSHLILAITVFMPTQTSYAPNNILHIYCFCRRDSDQLSKGIHWGPQTPASCVLGARLKIVLDRKRIWNLRKVISHTVIQFSVVFVYTPSPTYSPYVRER